MSRRSWDSKEIESSTKQIRSNRNAADNDIHQDYYGMCELLQDYIIGWGMHMERDAIMFAEKHIYSYLKLWISPDHLAALQRLKIDQSHAWILDSRIIRIFMRSWQLCGQLPSYLQAIIVGKFQTSIIFSLLNFAGGWGNDSWNPRPKQ